MQTSDCNFVLPCKCKQLQRTIKINLHIFNIFLECLPQIIHKPMFHLTFCRLIKIYRYVYFRKEIRRLPSLDAWGNAPKNKYYFSEIKCFFNSSKFLVMSHGKNGNILCTMQRFSVISVGLLLSSSVFFVPRKERKKRNFFTLHHTELV